MAFGSCWSTPAPAQEAPADSFALLFEQDPLDEPTAEAKRPRRGGGPKDRDPGARRGERGPERGFDRGFERGIWRRLSEEERAELYELVKENLPELYQELEKIRQDQTRRFHRRMARLAPKLLDLLDLMEVDPERGKLAIKEHKLEIRLRVLLLQYHKSQDELERAELRTMIKPVVVQKLECRQERHEQEIRNLEARIAHLRDRLERAAANRDKLVAKALDRYLSEPPPDGPAERGFRGERREHGRGQRGRPGLPSGNDGFEPPPGD